MTVPSPFMWLLESRAILGLGAYLTSWPWLTSAPSGNGQPVLVLPGFMADDTTTLPLRYFLKNRGFNPHRWHQGRNTEFTSKLEKAMNERLAELFDRYEGQKVSIIGWSLGGVYARELARKQPEKVRQIITLGSPFGDVINGSNIAWVYEMINNRKVERVAPHLIAHITEAPPVPITAFYTKSDGIVAWESCIERELRQDIENIEVSGSHCGLGHNPLVLMCIADRLAQEEGNWKPFRHSHLKKLLEE